MTTTERAQAMLADIPPRAVELCRAMLASRKAFTSSLVEAARRRAADRLRTDSDVMMVWREECQAARERYTDMVAGTLGQELVEIALGDVGSASTEEVVGIIARWLEVVALADGNDGANVKPLEEPWTPQVPPSP